VSTYPDTSSERSPSPGFGPAARPTFGLARDQGKRIEVTLALRNGGTLLAIDEMQDELTDEMLESYTDQLAKDIAAGATRTFTDGWTASGQHAWVLLREVVAFSVRPSK
jgi:hypothetical protein